jgi:hypothetical protein
MKLPEFVGYLLDPAKLADFYRALGLFPELVDAYGVAIYMVGSTIELDADIHLLSYRETQGRTEIQLEGTACVYVLDVDLASDLLRDSEAAVVTKLDQANRIIHHALYDYRA